MSLTVDLQRLTVPEKLRLMEALWQDLLQVENEVPSPEWHRNVLAEREEKIARGEELFVDWETAKKVLREELQ